MKNKDKKRVASIGWMPFWWGNKFNKRLASKRVRRKIKQSPMEENDYKKDIGLKPWETESLSPEEDFIYNQRNQEEQ